MYGNEICSFKRGQVLEKVCQRYFKLMLGVNVTPCNARVYIELGEVPVSSYIQNVIC